MSEERFEPPQQTWTARVGWRPATASSGGSPIRQFDELPPSGDAAANIPPTQVTADGPVPGGHMPCRIGFPVASRRIVFEPRHFAGILAEMRPGDMVMLTNLRASQPGDIAFPGLVRAGAIFAVGFPMIDPLHCKGRMKIVPSSRLVGMDNAASGDATTNDWDSVGLMFHDCRHGQAAPLQRITMTQRRLPLWCWRRRRSTRASRRFTRRTWPPNHPPSISTTPLKRVVAKFAAKAHRSLCSKTNAVFACSPR